MNSVEINHFLGRLLLSPFFKDSAKQALEYLRRPMEWEPIIEAASENLITPALYTSFHSLNMFHDLPEELQDYLMEIHQCNAMRNQEIKSHVLQLASLFNKIDVEPLFLKGVANLFFDIYPDPADRILHDADILVPKEKILECVNILKKEGYYSVHDESLFCKTTPHYLPLVSNKKRIVVELHQYSTSGRFSSFYSENDFWTSSVTRNIEDIRFRLPSPMNNIKHHIIHAHKHYGIYSAGHFFLRGLYDLALLCKKFENQIHWSQLETDFVTAGLRKEFFSYLLVADKFCGYQDPLQYVRIKKSDRLFLHTANIFLNHTLVFALWKLFSQYKQAVYGIASDRKRRKELLKKLKTLQFYAKHMTNIRQSLIKK
jgi:hypothetical protein